MEELLATRLFLGLDTEIANYEAESFREVFRRYLGNRSVVITGRTESNRGSFVGTSKRTIGLTFFLGKIEGEWKLSSQVISDISERRGSQASCITRRRGAKFSARRDASFARFT